jgi:DNA-binding Xre family transcriptional regulator
MEVWIDECVQREENGVKMAFEGIDWASVSGENISYRDICEATGISPNTITQMATGKAKRVDLRTVDRLLDFLGSKTGDTLTLDDLLKRYPA